jgi:hypothetical protein
MSSYSNALIPSPGAGIESGGDQVDDRKLTY